MANNSSSKKRIQQSHVRMLRNRVRKERLKQSLRAYTDALKSGDKELASKELSNAQKALEKAGTKGILHRRAVDRKKSRLALALNKLGA